MKMCHFCGIYRLYSTAISTIKFNGHEIKQGVIYNISSVFFNSTSKRRLKTIKIKSIIIINWYISKHITKK